MNSVAQKKWIAGVALVALIATGTVAPFFAPKAKADVAGDFARDCLGSAIISIFGGALLNNILSFLSPTKAPTTNTGGDQKIKEFELKTCLNRLKDLAIMTARNVLKKRLLDQIVDQTVSWIRGETGGAPPGFIEDFGSVFEKAINEGIGDTIDQIGLAQLCSGDLRAKLELNFSTPPDTRFSTQAGCTLDQVVRNIDSFGRSFENGGWVAFNELSKPQNNKWGLEILAHENLIAKTEEAKSKRLLEVQVGGGFDSQKQCTEWTRLVLRQGDGPAIEQVLVPGSVGWQERNYNPLQPPSGNTPPVPLPAGAAPGIYPDWRCTKEGVTTPASVKQGTAEKVVNLDLDYILNADEFDAYITALTDAVVYRLSHEAVCGLKGLFSAGAGCQTRTGGNVAGGTIPWDTSRYQGAIDNYRGAREAGGGDNPSSWSTSTIVSSTGPLSQQVTALVNSLTNIRNGLLAASSTNTSAMNALHNPPPRTPRGLNQCLQDPNLLQTVFTPPDYGTTAGVMAHYNTALTRRNSITTYYRQITAPLTPAPGGLLARAQQLQTMLAAPNPNIQDIVQRLAALQTEATTIENQAPTLQNEAMIVMMNASSNLTTCENNIYSP